MARNEWSVSVLCKDSRQPTTVDGSIRWLSFNSVTLIALILATTITSGIGVKIIVKGVFDRRSNLSSMGFGKRVGPRVASVIKFDAGRGIYCLWRVSLKGLFRG